MKITKLHLWAAFAIIEAVVIALLVASRVRLVVKQTESPVMAVTSPLKLALEYEASDEKFENLVKEYPEWISYRSSNKGAFNWPILADCALLKRTNYVRILIAHGADVEEAVEYLKQTGSEDAIDLLRQVQGESNPK